MWDYTVKTCSENQAEIYYSLLIDSCQELANKPNLGKPYEIVKKEVLGYKIGEPIIFYRIVSVKEIDILRILHRMMDMKHIS
ncbi:type II toxin-antitoxin system RelE/ParE family toxin [Flavobacterium granuli]|uniref:type II toxin-antitoxin system RelE/ParE family toxin n=1 Tax=Flavobacterium granuli TaxID=280093 RepID=UPI000932C84C|nr:type II toxin-antitoxin system RelE/ParE family toxin [Flavobacterium granuli]